MKVSSFTINLHVWVQWERVWRAKKSQEMPFGAHHLHSALNLSGKFAYEDDHAPV